jgi:hypothetical protein
VSLFGTLFGAAPDPEATRRRQAEADRAQAWQAALPRDAVPAFVQERLGAAAAGRAPWVATTTVAELLLARSHGVRPVAMVSATCWFHFGVSWTKGHAAGWRAAQARLQAEAVAAGANAVLDVAMRTTRLDVGASMDFTLVGTAVRIEGLPPSPEPVIATCPAIEFVRLVEAGIVPVGIAVGAHYEWLYDSSKSYGGGGPLQSWTSRPLGTLGEFWERVRREAHRELRADTARQGNGVLAHTQFGQLLKQEGGENAPDRYLGRHIVLGTVVQCRPGETVLHAVTPVLDMRDGGPLNAAGAGRSTPYDDARQDGI